jgi:uncharacterized protein (UPF0332 family)
MLFEKAQESLSAAELCFKEKLYNSTANRAYYAMFQAAIVALEKTGIRSQGEQWSHDRLQATFAGELTRNRKIFPRTMARDLHDVCSIRNQADYKERTISKQDAVDALKAARNFIDEVGRKIKHE